MTQISPSPRSYLKSWFAREDGLTSIEFVAMFPIAMIAFMAAGENAMLNLRQTYLDRALEMTVRELRLGQIASPTVAILRNKICSRMVSVDNCLTNLTLELNVRSTAASTMTVPSLTASCINRATNVEPVLTFDAGVANDMVLVRACLVQDVVFPTSMGGVTVFDDIPDEFQIVSTTAYVNEPR